MNARSDDGAGALLAALVETADACANASALLHEDARLHRLDGTSLTGRGVIVDAIITRGSEARFQVLGSLAESVYVALEIDGLPGRLVFTMTGSVRDGRLAEIWMIQEPDDA
jgi:hypothetical protein